MYSQDDTIVAVSTPLGHGGLGVIRLSGGRAVEIADSLFTSSAPHRSLASLPSHSLHHGWLSDNGVPVDEVMVALMRAPRSYTGEDVVEISAHGGPVILRRIVSLCAGRGARIAEPGEFTLRAFLSGRMDLARAEAVADLIASRTDLAAAAALEQLKGRLSGTIRSWRTELVELLASLEASLDHAEEDIRFITPGQTAEKLGALLAGMKRLQETAAKGTMLRQGLKTAIVGKPNTGKSSLLNALLEKDRALVTDIPGTTRDVIEETLDCRGLPVVIMDTAGLREHTADPVEKLGQERTRECMRSADAVLWVVDASTPLSEADVFVRDLIVSLGAEKKTILVFNKIDLGAALNNGLSSMGIAPLPMVKLSALTRQGLDGLESALVALSGAHGGLSAEPVLANLRHRDALHRSGQALEAALGALERQETEELLAVHVREALSALGEITGETATEEILHTIFSKFCVGK